MEWAALAWRAAPVVLVLAWLLALIGGFSAGGLVHVLVLGALAFLAWDPMRGQGG